MKNNLNYPIKYAIQELKINNGYDSNYQDITFGFIISKCYVVNQNIRYFQDGTSKLTYNVVFPYKDIQTFKYHTLKLGYPFNEIASTPHYSLFNECLNDTIVSEVFDTYEEALIEKEKSIKDYRKKIVSQIYKMSQLDKIIKEFEESLIICNKYEEIVTEKTNDMIIYNEDISIKRLSRKPNNS